MSDQKFAKLFERDGVQIVVMVSETDDGDPALKFVFKPVGLGICAMTVSLHSEDAAYEGLSKVTEDTAFSILKEVEKDWSEYEDE